MRPLLTVNFASAGQSQQRRLAQHAVRCDVGTRARAVGMTKCWPGCAAFIIRSGVDMLPSVEGISVFEPPSREDRTTHEVWQPADSSQISTGCDVVVRPTELAQVVGSQSKRRAERELVGR